MVSEMLLLTSTALQGLLLIATELEVVLCIQSALVRVLSNFRI